MKIPPAAKLKGQTLKDGWVVEAPTPKFQGATGSCFSFGYVVSRDKKFGQPTSAFLKALDFSSAMRSPDPARALQPLIDSFNFERDLLDKCRSMNRIVTALTDGSITIDGQVVQYIVFELAECDVRKKIVVDAVTDENWKLRTLHHVAVGLRQLHSAKVAHLDLKPSNVLQFSGDLAKIGDLGRSIDKDVSAPHSTFAFPGAKTYAPPEHLYGDTSKSWAIARLASDFYLLGSLTYYLFTKTPLTPALMRSLQPQHRHTVWGGTYIDVMPFIEASFEELLLQLPQYVEHADADELVSLIRMLAHPDPYRRGHPRSKAIGVPFDLSRFISKFDLAAAKARLNAAKSA